MRCKLFLGCLAVLLSTLAASAQYGPIRSAPAPGCDTSGVILPPGTSIQPGMPGGPPLTSTPSGQSPLLDGGVLGGAGSAIGGGGGEGGSGGLASGAPNMIGDIGPRGLYRERGNYQQGQAGSPIVGQAAFRIVENESARPADRVFTNYNYFNAVGDNGNNNYGLHRIIVGFEKTLFDGRASFGARLPLQYRNGGTGESIDGIADLTLIGKYALLLDKEKGNAVSVGVAATIHLGRSQELEGGGNLDGSLIQPWAGFVVCPGRLIVQGYTAAVLPTKSLDTRLLANDIGVGYRLYSSCDCGRTLTGIVPVIEAHLITPLSNSGLTRVQQGSQMGTPDQLVLTAGVHFGLWNQAWLTLGAGAPVTGGHLFQYEGLMQFNVGF